MERRPITTSEFKTDIFDTFLKDWMLLTAGDFQSGRFNQMTIAWGFMGGMWFKPAVMVVVRPQRHTLQFMDKYDDFTICAFPESKKEVLSFCGSHSGKELNKTQECGLTPIPGEKSNAPGYEEATLIIECRKLYRDQYKAKNFLEKSILDSCYPERDLHYMFVGEIMHISGIDKYRRKSFS